jgi:hypothetical protein
MSIHPIRHRPWPVHDVNPTNAGQDLIKGVAVGDQAVGEEGVSSLYDVSLLKAELFGQGGVGPERASGLVGRQMQKEEERVSSRLSVWSRSLSR